MYGEYSDEFYDLVDQYVASGRYGGRPEAADAVRRARPDLCPKPKGKGTMTMISSSSGGAGGSAEAELDRRARQYQREHPGVSYAQAYVDVLNSDPRLYIAYLRERLAQVDAGARRG